MFNNPGNEQEDEDMQPECRRIYCKTSVTTSMKKMLHIKRKLIKMSVSRKKIIPSNYENECQLESDRFMMHFFRQRPEKQLPKLRDSQRFVTTRKLMALIAAGVFNEIKVLVVKRKDIFYIVDPSETGPTKLEMAMNGVFSANSEDKVVRRGIFYTKFDNNHVAYFSTIDFGEINQFTCILPEYHGGGHDLAGRHVELLDFWESFARNTYWKMYLGACTRIVRIICSQVDEPTPISIRDRTSEEFVEECRKMNVLAIREIGQENLCHFFDDVVLNFNGSNRDSMGFQLFPNSRLRDNSRNMARQLFDFEKMIKNRRSIQSIHDLNLIIVQQSELVSRQFI